MSKYRNNLPQLNGDLFLTNGGLETTLIYHEKIKLPYFSAFDILKDDSGYQWMKNYLRTFVNIAQKSNLGFILESPTWRAHPDWIKKLNYSDEDIIDINQKSIQLIEEVRNEFEREDFPIVLNASIGPRGDGYNPTFLMTPEESFIYHSKQIEILSETNVDMITALTFNYPNEAIGIVQAAKQYHMPIVVSFTLETDAKLPTGQSLKETIQIVDKATNNTPIYYMVNCTHPTVLQNLSFINEDWTDRIHGIKGNASKKSHAELDQSNQLDDGDTIQFAKDIQLLLFQFKYLNILGGCCGTDHRHLQQISKLCLQEFNQKQEKHL
jgi:S-methylmethionine-dependent homocysteine/selenocysteine methylase